MNEYRRKENKVKVYPISHVVCDGIGCTGSESETSRGKV
jgi:hypothetical protein